MRYAVAFVTYAWNPFVARQHGRIRERVRSGDVFVIADETRGPVDAPAIPIIRTKAQTIHHQIGAKPFVQKGYFGSSNPLWWNMDYHVYRFFAEHPGYDYCLLVDYDACL